MLVRGSRQATTFAHVSILAVPILFAIAHSSAVGSDDASFCSARIVLFHTHHRSFPFLKFGVASEDSFFLLLPDF